MLPIASVNTLKSVYVGGNRGSGLVSVRRYKDNGALQLSVLGNFQVLGITTDSNRNFYTGGSFINNDGVVVDATRKYNKDGVLLWTVNNFTVSLQGLPVGIAVDNLGNVYTNTLRYNDTTTYKYDSDGNLIWSRDHGAGFNISSNITVDVDGFVYTGGSRINNITTRKYDSDGNLIWSLDHGAEVLSVAVDNDSNVYTAGARFSINISTRKYDTDGNLIWSRDHGATVRSVAVDKNGFVYTTGDIIDDVTTRKYNSDGDLIWSINDQRNSNSIALDKEGNIYTGGLDPTLSIIKYDNNGNLIWSNSHGASILSVDTFPPNKGAFLS
jgi:hypothetical protein